MKGWGLPALRLRAIKVPIHWLDTAGILAPFDVSSYRKNDVGRCQGRAEHRQRGRAAPPGEGRGKNMGKNQLYEKLSGNVDIQERPRFAGSYDTLSRECHSRAKWLLHFVLALTLSLTSFMSTSVPGGGFRVILAGAVPADATEGGRRQADPDIASLAAGGVVAQYDLAFQRRKDQRSAQLRESQRKAALLGLEKHQRLWPTFAHGKSKRGSIVLYRLIPQETALHQYDPRSDLPIDAALLQHLLQTVPPDTGFLLVVDLQRVADYIRASMEPVSLASLHKGSSLMQFVKSVEWQMIRKMFFVRPRCEGIILINAPAIVQQARSILEYLLFSQGPGSRREKLSLSDGRVSGLSPSKERCFLQSSSDVKALHAAVDASELPLDYALTLDFFAKAGPASTLRAETLSEDCPPSGEVFIDPEVNALSSPSRLGESPEHLAFSAAILEALLQFGVEDTHLSKLSSETPTPVTAKREVPQQHGTQEQKTYDCARAKVTELNYVGAEECASATEKKDADALRLVGSALQRKKFYAALVERGIREISVKELQKRVSAIKEKIPGESVMSPSDLRRDRFRAGFAPELQQNLALEHSLRSGSSSLPSYVAHVSTQARAQRSNGSQSFKNRRTDRKEDEASTKQRSSAFAEDPSEYKRTSLGREGSSRQSFLTDDVDTNEKTARGKQADVRTGHYNKRATSTGRQQKGVSRQTLSRHYRASHTTRARLAGAPVRRIRQTKEMAPDARGCNNNRESCAYDVALHDCATYKQEIQGSSNAPRNAAGKVVRERARQDEPLSGNAQPGRTVQSGIPVQREASQRALHFDSNIKHSSGENSKNIFSKHLSYAGKTCGSASAESLDSPQVAPRFAQNTVSRSDDHADESYWENQERSDDPPLLVDTEWMERLDDRSNSLRNSSVSIERRGRQNWSQQASDTAVSQTGSDDFKPRPSYKSYFLSEKDTTDEEFDDID